MNTTKIFLSLLLIASSANAASLGTVRDSNGVLLGTLLNIDDRGTTVVTPTAYIVRIYGDGNVSNLEQGNAVLYLTSTCTGQLYGTVTPGTVWPFATAPGQINPPLYYVPRDAVVTRPAVGTTYYYWNNTVCNASTIDPVYGPFWIVPAYPNDPAVTGISLGSFLPPLRITFEQIFGDGFDTAA